VKGLQPPHVTIGVKGLKTKPPHVTIGVKGSQKALLTLSVPGEKLSSASRQILLGVLFSTQVIFSKIFDEKCKISLTLVFICSSNIIRVVCSKYLEKT
jgi:hypothetical protein